MKVSFSSWSPGADTLSSSWFQRRPRWLTLVGIPYHLYSEETVKSLNSKFGVIKNFSSVRPKLGGLSISRVLIDNCDVRSLPHFIPLVDLGGVVYPVRLLLDLSDSSHSEAIANDSIGSISEERTLHARSFAE